MRLTYEVPYKDETITVELEAFPIRESDYGFATEKYGINIVSEHEYFELFYLTQWRNENIVMLDELFCKNYKNQINE